MWTRLGAANRTVRVNWEIGEIRNENWRKRRSVFFCVFPLGGMFFHPMQKQKEEDLSCIRKGSH